MPLSTSRRPRTPLALLVGLLPVALVTGLLGPTGPGVAAIPKDQTVTISALQSPVYGNELTFKVSASASDNALQVFHGNTPLIPGGGIGMENGEPTPVSIPTLGRFHAGVTYTLRADVDNGDVKGTRSFTFTPGFIPSRVDLAATTIAYSAPLLGDLVPTVTTSVAPGPGAIALVRDGSVRARYDVRTDGTFALEDPTMTPGTYSNVQVYYEGDESYSRNFVGSGMAVADVVVTKIPTTTTAALSAAKVVQGAPVNVLASTASSLADTTADVQGVMEVHAAPAGSEQFAKITEIAYPGGKQQVSLSLQEWASTHPGFWTIRTVNHGTDISAGSASDATLQVVAPGHAVTDTATELALGADTATVLGAPVGATATVTSGAGPVTTGSVAFSVRGTVVATVPLSANGTAATTLRAATVGSQPVSAVYLGTTDYGWSSAAGSLTGLKAATVTTATPPRGSVHPGATVPVRVTATGSTVVPAGAVSVMEGSRVLGTVRLTRGAGSFRLPNLAAGRHTLTVRYAGDAGTTASRTTTAISVAPIVKVRSTTRASVRKLAGRKARLTVRIAAAKAVAGVVEVRRGATVVARARLVASAHGTLRLVTRQLPKGTSRLTVRYLGSSTVKPSASKRLSVRLR